jgi:hypothetical protein
MARTIRGQIAIEFVIFVGFGIFVALLLLLSITSLSEQKTDEKTYYEIDDFGIGLQRELILASEMEHGYVRRFNIPQTVNGRRFNITTGNTSSYNGYMTINYNNMELYYVIPVIDGTLVKGNNVLRKINTTLQVN